MEGNIVGFFEGILQISEFVRIFIRNINKTCEKNYRKGSKSNPLWNSRRIYVEGRIPEKKSGKNHCRISWKILEKTPGEMAEFWEEETPLGIYGEIPKGIVGRILRDILRQSVEEMLELLCWILRRISERIPSGRSGRILGNHPE